MCSKTLQKQSADSSTVHWQGATGRCLQLKTRPKFYILPQIFKEGKLKSMLIRKMYWPFLFLFLATSNQIEIVFLMSSLLPQTPCFIHEHC